jgi:membrane protein YqaA with SNARE-associated domain
MDGSLGEFRCGVGLLAQQGAVVIPVGLAGTRDVLPKRKRFPRRASVAAVFGEPRCFDPDTPAEEIAATLRGVVSALAGEAEVMRQEDTEVLSDRLASFALSRRARVIAFLWGVGEAVFWPLIPEFYVAPLAFAAPSSFLSLSLFAITGSTVGGALGYLLGGTQPGGWLVVHLPLVTERMHTQAFVWMKSGGVWGLLHQPLSGVPFKAFSLEAARAGLSLPGFATVGAGARGLRILAVAGIFAGGGIVFGSMTRRHLGWVLIAYCLVFTLALRSTVLAWR